MKNHLLFFCLLFVFVSCVSAQYPKDETVSPYPLPVVERTNVQYFNDFPQWKALHQTQLNVHDSTLHITSSGSDPYVLLPPVKSDAGTGLFEFRITMKSSLRPKAELFWATQKQPNFCAENAVQFNFESAAPQANAYSVRFQTDSPLTALRFDPGASEGVAEITAASLERLALGELPKNPTPWAKPNWADSVKEWKTLSDKEIIVKFAADGTGAQIFRNENLIGEIYPLAMRMQDTDAPPLSTPPFPLFCSCQPLEPHKAVFKGLDLTLEFVLSGDELQFEVSSSFPVFGPVFRPAGTMQQAVLNGAEYLETGEHSSSTADITTEEHLRFVPPLTHITWAFMGLSTEKTGFGLFYDNPDETQPVFATPDNILSLPQSHYLGLYGKKLSGTVKVLSADRQRAAYRLMQDLILWGVKKNGLPELPLRFRNDKEQQELNQAAFERSLIVCPDGWRHAVTPGAAEQHFPASYGNDFVSAVWQVTGNVPQVPKLDHGGGHLRNPASFFLLQKGQEFLEWTRNETAHLLAQQKEDGSFRYSGKYLQGHWEDTASGHCGNALYRLMYNERILGDPKIIDAVRKGLEFANQYAVPRGAQVWELSLHTPDIMGASRMCMANAWMYEATGEELFLRQAERWAVTGLPFVYLRQKQDAPGAFVMKYATVPVLGATNWTAPNWMGLPVQWCGLDYSEALFMLAKHSTLLDWQKIAEGILIAAEQMQYPDGVSIGLLPDSFEISAQQRNPADISPSVLVMQRRRLQGKVDSVSVAVSGDRTFRVVSPFSVRIEGDSAVIDGQKGTTYQVLINGSELRTIESQGQDRIRHSR